MHEQDPHIRIAEDLVAQDKISIFVLQCAGTHDSREARYEHDHQSRNDRKFPVIQDTDHDQGDQDTGEGIDGIYDTHDDLVQHAARVTAHKPQYNADHCRQQDCGDGYQKREARADHGPAEDIAPEIIRAEKVCQGRCL